MERLVYQRLRPDESTQLDELIEKMEAEMGSAEIFTALFELELAGAGAADAGEELCAGILRRGPPTVLRMTRRVGVDGRFG